MTGIWGRRRLISPSSAQNTSRLGEFYQKIIYFLFRVEEKKRARDQENADTAVRCLQEKSN